MKKLQVFKNKQVIGAICSIALVVTAAIGVTTALYKTETDPVVNQFTVGSVTTELVEEFYTEDGTEFTKNPKVTNTGANSCLVRVRVAITPESVVAREVTIGGKVKPYLEIYTDAEKPYTNRFIYNDASWSNDSWEYRNGWYYYKDVVDPGESTDALFETVVVNYDAEAGDPNAWEDFDIIIYQEAVQSVVYDGDDVYDASKNFEHADKIWKAYDGQTAQSDE